MPRAFGFDGDSAYYESLRDKVLADQQAQKATAEEAARERRLSKDSIDDEGLSRQERKAAKKLDPNHKSLGEKVANFVFNGGRSETVEQKQMSHKLPTYEETVKVPRTRDDVIIR